MGNQPVSSGSANFIQSNNVVSETSSGILSKQGQATRRASSPLLGNRVLWTACVLLMLFAVSCLTGCGAGGYAGAGIVSLSTSNVTIDAGQSFSVTANLSGTANVSWNLTGAACTGSACGTVASTSVGVATYTAPAGLTSPIHVTLTAAIDGTANAKTVAITVNPDPVIAAGLPSGTVGASYQATLTATGGTSPLKQISLLSGQLPPGLTYNPATSSISGVPTAAGTFNFTVQVTDSSDIPFTATTQLSLTIQPSAVVPTLTITGVTPAGSVGTPYVATLAASGGVAPYTFTLASGTLPAGLSLSASTGVISGTPTTQSTSTFVAQVKDSTGAIATATFTIAINAAALPPLTLTLSTLPNGVVGTPYSATIGVSGGSSPYSCLITAGSLPAGLSLGAGCVVSGTPTTAGTSTVTVKVTDGSNPANTTSGPISITITAGAPTPLTLTVTSLPAGQVAIPYSATIGVSGGTAPYSCSIVSGTLPAGLTLGAGCVVSGTPTVAGTANLTVKATDSASPTQSVTGPVSITIAPAALTLTLSTLPGGTVGTPYSATVGVTGGTSPYSCSLVAGSLPAGLTLSTGCVGSSGRPVVLTAPPTIRGWPRSVQGPDQCGALASPIASALLCCRAV